MSSQSTRRSLLNGICGSPPTMLSPTRPQSRGPSQGFYEEETSRRHLARRVSPCQSALVSPGLPLKLQLHCSAPIFVPPLQFEAACGAVPLTPGTVARGVFHSQLSKFEEPGLTIEEYDALIADIIVRVANLANIFADSIAKADADRLIDTARATVMEELLHALDAGMQELASHITKVLTFSECGSSSTSDSCEAADGIDTVTQWKWLKDFNGKMPSISETEVKTDGETPLACLHELSGKERPIALDKMDSKYRCRTAIVDACKTDLQDDAYKHMGKQCDSTTDDAPTSPAKGMEMNGMATGDACKMDVQVGEISASRRQRDKSVDILAPNAGTKGNIGDGFKQTIGTLEKTSSLVLEAAESARLAYAEASAMAEKDLDLTHPILLGLALNYFEKAIAELDNVAEITLQDLLKLLPFVH